MGMFYSELKMVELLLLVLSNSISFASPSQTSGINWIRIKSCCKSVVVEGRVGGVLQHEHGATLGYLLPLSLSLSVPPASNYCACLQHLSRSLSHLHVHSLTRAQVGDFFRNVKF